MTIGEAVLSAFMQALFEKVIAAAFGELKLPRDVAEELEKLSSSLSTIQAHVEDAEERQLKDKAARSWLGKLKDVAYEMDDLLDDYTTEALRSKLEGQSKYTHLNKVRTCLCCFWLNTCLSNHKILQEIRKVEKKLDRLVKERQIIGPNMIITTDRKEIKERPETSSIVDDSSVFGREEDKEIIVKMLLGQKNSNSNHASLSVLPIVGMGGLGKTTLAQLVYNDTRIRNHFQLRVWLCVSQNFDQMKLTRETIESVASEFESVVSGVSSVTTNMNLLQEDLSNKLKGKKFLLVLDDVWNEDPEKWDTYRRSLVTGGKGSRIVVTTRNKNVGKLMGGMDPYYLNQLSDSDCWYLFRSYAFVGGNSSARPNLEIIGMEIVKKLKGLPLAAKAIGSLLCSQDTEDDWKNVLRSEIWELPSDKNNVLPALRLSYNHLPAILKRCFAFCSVFHKDYVFEKDSLVQIWMALGFIQPEQRRRIEEIGSSYFDELLSRSFFKHHKGGYVMHDAMHDLAQSVSIHECLRLNDLPNSSSSASSVRHLSFSCDNRRQTSFEAFLEFKRTRTLLLLSGYKSMTRSIPSDLFLKLRYLHVLDLNRRDITELPDSIGRLKMLRYLNLSGTGIRRLPSTIARTELITGIARIGNLTSLQQLEEFVVRTGKGYRISELKAMKGIRGHVCIRNIESVASADDACEAYLTLGELPQLKYLYIWGFPAIIKISQEFSGSIGGRGFPSLKELVFEDLANLKMWASIQDGEFLPSLTELAVIDCPQVTEFPSLPLTLKKFKISETGFSILPEVCIQSSQFSSSLACLQIHQCPNLTSLQDGLLSQQLLALEQLTITHCSDLIHLPVEGFRSLTSLGSSHL
uniref:Uncharacterized protein n=1 Tax=Avena sativa TaxID=4498 RepID=A0ACD5TA30_AVESA